MRAPPSCATQYGNAGDLMKECSFSQLFARPVPWLKPAAGKPLVIVSSRVRLARNLNVFPFPNRAGLPQRREVWERVCAAVRRPAAGGGGFLCGEMTEFSEPEKQLLVERRLASRELVRMGAGSGIAVDASERLSVMVNEEDHLRIQALLPGFDLNGAWRLADELDTALGRRRAFAYDPQYGFLTACPSNAGTGMRASVMLHIPALAMSGQVEPLMRGAHELAFAVRGMLGEGSDAVGNFFQISNQSTLGESERETLCRLRAAVLRIAHAEAAAREKLLGGRRLWLYDQVGQACGRLRFAYLLPSKEALNALSLVLLGGELGLLPKVKRTPLLRLLMTVQSGHLQRRAKSVLDETGRDAYRAALVRAFLAAAEGNA